MNTMPTCCMSTHKDLTNHNAVQYALTSGLCLVGPAEPAEAVWDGRIVSAKGPATAGDALPLRLIATNTEGGRYRRRPDTDNHTLPTTTPFTRYTVPTTPAVNANQSTSSRNHPTAKREAEKRYFTKHKKAAKKKKSKHRKVRSEGGRAQQAPGARSLCPRAALKTLNNSTPGDPCRRLLEAAGGAVPVRREKNSLKKGRETVTLH